MAENLSAEIMKEVKRYDDGNGCTRQQLVDNIMVAISHSRAAVAAPRGDETNDTVGLNLFRQLVGEKNALRSLGVFPCNQAEHEDVDCKCFWEQCERWAKQDAATSSPAAPSLKQDERKSS